MRAGSAVLKLMLSCSPPSESSHCAASGSSCCSRCSQSRKPGLHPRLRGFNLRYHRFRTGRQDVLHRRHHGHALQPPHRAGRGYAGPRTHDLPVRCVGVHAQFVPFLFRNESKLICLCALCVLLSAVWLRHDHHPQNLHVLCVHCSLCHLWHPHAARRPEDEP